MSNDGNEPTNAASHIGDAASTVSFNDLSGQTHGDFKIIRLIGRGGMGEVYLAEQVSLKRQVALKLLKSELLANPVALARFRAEAEAVASLNHPNIVHVYMVGDLLGMPFMALEYVSGISLRDYLVRKGAPDIPRALLVMRKIAAALQAAGEQGIVHRDIKPENILLSRKGEVKVTDFGLSRLTGNERELSLTQTGLTMGTPLYMSPEQAQGNPVDPRSDIYSFGVTCYHMLAGRPPFGGKNAVEVALKHVNETPPALIEQRPDVPPALAQLVHRMMQKDPAARPQTAKDVVRDLNAMRGQIGDAAEGATGLAIQTPGTITPNTLDLTAPFPSPTSRSIVIPRPKFSWKFVAAVALAFLIGIASRVTLNRSNREKPAVPTIEMGDNEKFLLGIIREYSSANLSDPEKLKNALRNNLELAILYVEQHRQADAEAFAERLSRDTRPEFQFLAKVIQGINYSMIDDAAKSNKTLESALADRTAKDVMKMLTTPPSAVTMDFRMLLQRALERNERTGPLPKELNDLKIESREFTRGKGGAPKGKGG